MKLENAVNFMMYSYFNLTLEDGKEKEKVLNAVIKRAYSDATQQGAYNTQLTQNCGKKGAKGCTQKCMQKNSEKCIKEKSEKAKGGGIEEISVSIKDLLETGVGDFENWHKIICEKLRSIYADEKIRINGDEIFTYGNAQKWVNMSLKYMCILYEIYKTYVPECEFCAIYGANIEKYEKDFHIPVDSYIIEAVWDKTDIKLPIKEKWIKKRGKCNHDKVTSWSKWKDTHYLDFQKSLHESGLLKDQPLDWENEQWIKVAKARKD